MQSLPNQNPVMVLPDGFYFLGSLSQFQECILFYSSAVSIHSIIFFVYLFIFVCLLVCLKQCSFILGDNFQYSGVLVEEHFAIIDLRLILQ